MDNVQIREVTMGSRIAIMRMAQVLIRSITIEQVPLLLISLVLSLILSHFPHAFGLF